MFWVDKNDTLPPGWMLDLVSNHYFEFNLTFTFQSLNWVDEDGTLPLGWMDGVKIKLCVLAECWILMD